MSNLGSLKRKLRSRIHTIEVLLAIMTTPVQNPAQELMHADYIKRINSLTYEANTYFFDIVAECGDDIITTELDDFRISILNIERRKFATQTELCTWKTSQTKASPPLNQASGDTITTQDKEDHKQKEATEEAKSTYTHIKLDYDALKQEVTQHGN